MTNLHAIFGALTRYHIATAASPLSEPTAGVTWVWAGNGIFKRGVDQVSDILIQVATVSTPGLATLAPRIHWQHYPQQLPGHLLGAILVHARRAGTDSRVACPIEQQYHITREQSVLRVRLPPQQASPTRVSYQLGRAPVLCDVHSHHAMPAYFSSMDDRDDAGLSVSVVLGRIFERPEIAVRANVYGHRQLVPALAIFDALPSGLHDTHHSEVRHAIADH